MDKNSFLQNNNSAATKGSNTRNKRGAMDAIARTDIGAGFPLPQAILSAGYAANLPPFETGDDGTETYYHMPWETLASIVGGDSRYAYSTRDVVGAVSHLFVAIFLGPFSYLFSLG